MSQLAKIEPDKHQGQLNFLEKALDWYIQDYSLPPADTVRLFEEYSHVPSGELEKHIRHIRDEAWKIHPEPCIGLFKFISLTLHRLPCYSFILERLKNGGKYLDIGCCMGQDLRKLVMDGAPSDNLYGVDLYGGYLNLSYDLFRDRDLLKSHLGQGDILTMASEGDFLQTVKGTIDIIHIGMLLHCFGLEDQRQLIKRCLELLKSDGKTAIVGTALGDVDGAVGLASNYMHSDTTFKAMCNDVAKAANITLECLAYLDSALHFKNVQKDSATDRTRRLVFEIYTY